MTKDWVHGVGLSPVCQILLQIVMRAVITSFPPAWTSSAGILSTPAHFPFFNACIAASISLRRTGWSSCVCVWGQFSTDGSPLALRLYSSEQYSVHRFGICCSSVRHFPERSLTVVAFPCFTVVRSVTRLYALFLLLFLRFSPISLHCSPIRPRSGELRTQKLKSHLFRTQSLKFLPLNPGVGQYIVMHATLTAKDFFLANFYPSGPFTCIFPKPSEFFLC